jgi:hypothetical protein
METQNVVVYLLVTGAFCFLVYKYLKPIFAGKQSDKCEKDCNCK